MRSPLFIHPIILLHHQSLPKQKRSPSNLHRCIAGYIQIVFIYNYTKLDTAGCFQLLFQFVFPLNSTEIIKSLKL